MLLPQGAWGLILVGEQRFCMLLGVAKTITATKPWAQSLTQEETEDSREPVRPRPADVLGTLQASIYLSKVL